MSRGTIICLKDELPPRGPAANRLTKKQIKRLFKMFCIHKAEGERFPGEWNNCKACILREVPWQLGPGSHIFRDLCFAIWHEDILNA